MAPPEKYLLPTNSELQQLTDEKVKALIVLADGESRRSNVHTITGMHCGTCSFLCCLGVFVYLVVHGHETAAAVVLGATVLATIGRMIQGR